jgi:3',5'-cyclic AMP phosphodiesterase CpdA
MIRVAFTSDLHADLGPRNAALLPHLAHRAARLDPDVFVIAGDLAETAATVTASLRHFTELRARKFYLAGNHDLFVEDQIHTSRDKFERLLPAAAAAAGFEYLGLEARTAGALTIVAVPGWYDYSLRDPDLDVCVHRDHYRAGIWRDLRAWDRGHVVWAGDEAIADSMQARLETQLGEASGPGPILAVTHVLPFAELVVRGVFGDQAFHDAYLGSSALGAVLRRDPRIFAVLCGHLHRPADLTLDSRLRVLARPVGNAAKSRQPLEDLARVSIGVIEIPAAAVV